MRLLLRWGLFRSVGGHVALDVEAHQLRSAVCPHGDALLEVALKLALAVVGHLHLAFLARSYGLLGVCGDGASSACHGLVHDEWSRARVLEREHVGLQL